MLGEDCRSHWSWLKSECDKCVTPEGARGLAGHEQYCPAEISLMSAGSVGSKTFPVVVTSYEIIIADSKHLARYTWKYVVVDEGHRLKNFNCKLLRELRTIPTNNKLLLSGDCASLRALHTMHCTCPGQSKCRGNIGAASAG